MDDNRIDSSLDKGVVARAQVFRPPTTARVVHYMAFYLVALLIFSYLIVVFFPFSIKTRKFIDNIVFSVMENCEYIPTQYWPFYKGEQLDRQENVIITTGKVVKIERGKSGTVLLSVAFSGRTRNYLLTKNETSYYLLIKDYRKTLDSRVSPDGLAIVERSLFSDNPLIIQTFFDERYIFLDDMVRVVSSTNEASTGFFSKASSIMIIGSSDYLF